MNGGEIIRQPVVYVVSTGTVVCDCPTMRMVRMAGTWHHHNHKMASGVHHKYGDSGALSDHEY